ncbi:MAG: GTP-binding protein [Phototrophicales bacterium]|nr:MAG: GTP-binding protein [Phototrophicales bacterium]
MSYNQLSALPPEVVQLANLTHLYLSYNQLSALPPEVVQLANLTQLDLSANRLRALPPEVVQLANLTHLNLSGNQLSALPPEVGQLANLTQLYLSDNQLSALPPEVMQLKKLRILDLRGNPLDIPPEILDDYENPQAIIDYVVEQLAGATRALNEAKILFVGQGSVGKTSLIKRLINDPNDPYIPGEDKTEGIDIRQWCINLNNDEIRLNVWDFGGQEIMHATHQFFLTKRSLYVLVLDARVSEDQNRLEYWLRIIQSFGGDSPVIIVSNKIDEHPADLDKRGLQKKYPGIIKAFVETSADKNTGIDDLEAAITKEIGKLEHVSDQLPAKWFAVKSKLEKMDADFISLEQYQKLCRDEGIVQDRNQRTLLRFLHDLGIVLNFDDDPRLEETNILNPEWVTTGVYAILNSNTLFQSKGVLRFEELGSILDKKHYPRSRHIFIIDMMRKFELCFDFEGMKDEQFLVPDLLTKEEPDTGLWDDALNFRYDYIVLPSSIISRFIVRMQSHISRHTYWRHGVVLEHEGSRALVKADNEDKRIFVHVLGTPDARRRFLSTIRSQFKEIHKTIPGIVVQEKVPIPNNPEVAVSYEHLLTLERNNIDNHIFEGLDEPVSVQELLNGIESAAERRGKRFGDDDDDYIDARPPRRKESAPPVASPPSDEVAEPQSPSATQHEQSHSVIPIFTALILVAVIMIAIGLIFSDVQRAGLIIGAVIFAVVILGILLFCQQGNLGEQSCTELLLKALDKSSPSNSDN